MRWMLDRKAGDREGYEVEGCAKDNAAFRQLMLLLGD